MNNKIGSSAGSVERAKESSQNAQLNLPKGKTRVNEPVTKLSFEKRILNFHYHIIVVFLTLLLIYDLGYVLWERFSPFFGYLMTWIES